MIHYISGGQRSGKTNYAVQQALHLSDKPVYLATSRIWDDDHNARITLHKRSRDTRWENIEEEKEISRLQLSNKTVVLDCVTLWLTNFFVDNNYDVDKALAEAKKEFDAFIQQDFNLIIISNEIGMGVHASTEGGRKFADLQGWMNQYIAQKADKATLMVSGLPLTLK
ncbi:bifunctional adenosylcobinamide kinase/adenosylcobinamide-phosphate guanylyltransferase [Chitinophaga filiformis]|uniref:bifunctional adenosylcobinamide kinase/adenosylcobinamide-phosphate guanylyltransferase n=1 Tax=Chitinophaga filiformis TaxID=104663 RepID=UPI001F3767B0|nr:bifunctional adenosylcobinamide kinase/adenosylcobinamide-phosphate guanylyltransferase [Chitinophaga filiformis]MCF6405161.1 bifunctional adenosylcobinamide kinase/adenosylcobinamide-phosphate guanylyltransferase [Chitinophaga filiformis]